MNIDTNFTFDLTIVTEDMHHSYDQHYTYFALTLTENIKEI